MMNETILFPYFEAVARLCPFSQLRAAQLRLEEKYKERSKIGLEGFAEHAAYVLCRMPATFAAARRALKHLKKTLPSFEPKTLLDIGCGPGGALYAALEAFPTIQRATGLEKSADFVRLFNMLTLKYAPPSCLCEIRSCDFVYPNKLQNRILDEEKALGFDRSETGQYCNMDLFPIVKSQELSLSSKTDSATCLGIEMHEVFTPVDLAIASYSFGELPDASRRQMIEKASRLCRVLLIVEPGTPAGFGCLLACREQIIQMKASIVAPCTHMNSCPHEGSKRWCHESVRLFRTAIHRRLKGGELGYEDEKFSYLAVVFDSTLPHEIPSHRIIHVPQHRHGHSNFIVCSQDGQISKMTFSKKHKEAYREAKESEWGDSLRSICREE